MRRGNVFPFFFPRKFDTQTRTAGAGAGKKSLLAFFSEPDSFFLFLLCRGGEDLGGAVGVKRQI